MEVRHRQTRQTDPKGSRNRLCLVGPFGCGKTSLRSTFSGKSFAEKQHRVTIACQTICVQFPTEERPAEAGVNVIVDDTSGEERFRNMLTVNFVRHAQCVLLCFDLSSEDSLTEAQDTWLPWLTDQGRCGQSAVMLVGLKADLRYAVSSETIARWAEKRDMDYLETSSKTGHGLKSLEQHIGSFYLHHPYTDFGMTISDSGSRPVPCLLNSDVHEINDCFHFTTGKHCAKCCY